MNQQSLERQGASDSFPSLLPLSFPEAEPQEIGLTDLKSERDSAPAPLLLNIYICSGEKEGWELNPTESQF